MIELMVNRIIEKCLNGGSKCLKGKENEMKINSLQAELKEEKTERAKQSDTLFEKIDNLNKNIILGVVVLVISIVISKVLDKLI